MACGTSPNNSSSLSLTHQPSKEHSSPWLMHTLPEMHATDETYRFDPCSGETALLLWGEHAPGKGFGWRNRSDAARSAVARAWARRGIWQNERATLTRPNDQAIRRTLEQADVEF